MTHEDTRLITNPDWEECDRMWKQVNEWRKYASTDVRELWPTFNFEQQSAISSMLKHIALDEEWD